MAGRDVKTMAAPRPIKAIVLSIAWFSMRVDFDPSGRLDTPAALNCP
jgi:hypothetical protein